MTSRTGKNRSGFTLIEVMVTVAVLSLGLIMVYQAFFTALEAFTYCSDYLAISSWADEQIWQAQDQLRRTHTLGDAARTGQFAQNSRTVTWQLDERPVAALANLTQVHLEISWSQGRKEKGLSRDAYALYCPE